MPENSLPVKNLTSLLRKKLGDDLNIVKVDWKNLTDPGENYGSLIIAVNATVARNSETEVLNLVVKLPPPSAWLQELFNTPFTFLKELQFYRDLTPAFIALQRENGITEAENTWLGADYYGGRMGGTGKGEIFDDEAAIVLENLNYRGYKTVDRLLGLNGSQADLAVRKLGKLHGIAIAMRTRKPEIFEKMILPSLAQPANETAKNCVLDMIEKALDDLKNIPECERYMTSVEKTMKYLESVEHSTDTEAKDKWATLVHNDFWINNMMFKHDETNKSVIDMKIVDFQLCVYDYGVKDLIFFLISSPTKQVIEEEFDRLIDRYYEAFVDTLESMNVDATNFPKGEFLERFNECATLKFPQCLMMNQVIKSKPDVVPKMEDIKSKENFLTIGGGEIYHQKMVHTVQFYHERGWLKK